MSIQIFNIMDNNVYSDISTEKNILLRTGFVHTKEERQQFCRHDLLNVALNKVMAKELELTGIQ